MRFLIINTDYSGFLRWLYTQHPGLEKRPYEEQMRARMDSLFGVADFYSSNLCKLGFEAWDVHANNEPMQRAWAREKGVKLSFDLPWRFCLRPHRFPWVGLAREQRRIYEILAAQIEYFKPDVIVNQSIELSSAFFCEVKPYCRLLIGQHASPVPPGQDFSVYDLMISSLPNLVSFFRGQGLSCELHRLGFESTVLERLDEPGKTKPVSFVGSFFEPHSSRREWLDYVCRHIPLEVWGTRANGLPTNSPVLRDFHGAAWGLDMYRIFQCSKITLNHHIDMAESYANNMRLFEATGVGALLITDSKENLSEMFEVGSEVVTFRSPEECVELIRYYLDHDEERETIARAGQERTLKEHTYYHRMEELGEIVRKYL